MSGTGWFYGGFLLCSAACMLLVDRRWRLAVFRTPDRDEKDFASRVNSSWNKMQNKLRVLHAVGDDRAEISPVLRLLVDADQIRAITSEYHRIAREGGGESAAPSTDAEDDTE